jgi:hypothetical protein
MDEIALSAAIKEPAEFLSMFAEAARRGIDRFGDVIVPAEGIMNEILFAHDVKELDGVSVMDSTAVAWLHAEYMVKLARATGGRHLMPGVGDFLGPCRSIVKPGHKCEKKVFVPT